jgi:hypothetical protein
MTWLRDATTTPRKHASRLNMSRSTFSRRPCLVGDPKRLRNETAAWSGGEQSYRPPHSMFTTERLREKIGSALPAVQRTGAHEMTAQSPIALRSQPLGTMPFC